MKQYNIENCCFDFIENEELNQIIFFLSKDDLSEKIEQLVVGNKVFCNCSFLSFDTMNKTIKGQNYTEYEYHYEYVIENKDFLKWDGISTVNIIGFSKLNFARKNIEKRKDREIRYKDLIIYLKEQIGVPCFVAATKDNNHHIFDTRFNFQVCKNKNEIIEISELLEIIKFLKLFFVMFGGENFSISKIILNDGAYLQGGIVKKFFSTCSEERTFLLFKDTQPGKKIYDFYNINDLLYSYFQLLQDNKYNSILSNFIDDVLLEIDFFHRKIPNLVKLIEHVVRNTESNDERTLKLKIFDFKENILKDYHYKDFFVKNCIHSIEIIYAVEIRDVFTHDLEFDRLMDVDLSVLYKKLLGLFFTYFYQKLEIHPETIEHYWERLLSSISYSGCDDDNKKMIRLKIKENQQIQDEAKWGNIILCQTNNDFKHEIVNIFNTIDFKNDKVKFKIAEIEVYGDFDLTNYAVEKGKHKMFPLQRDMENVYNYIEKNISKKKNLFIINKNSGEIYFYDKEYLKLNDVFLNTKNKMVADLNLKLKERYRK